MTREDAQERQGILKRAAEYRAMLNMQGWRRIQQAQESWLMELLRELKAAKTADPETARDALRRWQIAEELVDAQTSAINDVLKQADEIRGSLGIEEALLMETIRNEYESASGDPGAGSTSDQRS